MRALIAFALAGACCWGADQREIQGLLSKEILGPRQATVEVQAYAQARTPVMPALSLGRGVAAVRRAPAHAGARRGGPAG